MPLSRAERQMLYAPRSPETVAMLRKDNLALVFARLQTSAALSDVEVIYNHVTAQAEALAQMHRNADELGECIVESQRAEHVWQEEAMQARQLAATMTDSWQQAQAEAAVMRAALEAVQYGWAGHFPCPECGNGRQDDHTAACIVGAALAGGAGKALLDELARLRAFVATVRGEHTIDAALAARLNVSLAALDAGEGQEVGDAE